MASILDLVQGKRISVGLENNSTNPTDFLIGLGILKGYQTKKYDAQNNKWIFASKWLSSPSLSLKQDGVQIDAVGNDLIEKYDTLQEYFKLFNFAIAGVRITGVSALADNQITFKRMFLTVAAESVDTSVNIDPYQFQNDIAQLNIYTIVGREGGIKVTLKPRSSLQMDLFVQRIVPISEDLRLGGSSPLFNGGSFNLRDSLQIAPNPPQISLPIGQPSGGNNNIATQPNVGGATA